MSNTAATAENVQEPFVHLQLGKLEIWIILDGVLIQDANLYALQATEEELKNLLADPGLTPQLPLSVCPILVKHGSEYFLFDTGVGQQIPGTTGLLPEKLASIGIQPEQISKIFITHLHVDHIGGAFDSQTGRPLFPRATVYIPEPEIDFWQDPDLSQLNRTVPAELVELTVQTAQRGLKYLAVESFPFGAQLFAGIEPVALPGHTIGQAGYLLSDPSSEQKLLFGGDVCHNASLHVPHPSWTTMGDSHPHLVEPTRIQLLKRIADQNILFRCFHFAPRENGFIRSQSNGQFQFVPA